MGMKCLQDGPFRIPEWLLLEELVIGTSLPLRDLNTQRTRQPNLKTIINSLADLARSLALQVEEAAKRLFF